MGSGENRQTGETGEADEAALSLGGLYDRYSREITLFVRHKVGDGPPEPDDIVQQTFVNFAGLKHPETIANARALISRSVVADSIGRYREGRRQGPGTTRDAVMQLRAVQIADHS